MKSRVLAFLSVGVAGFVVQVSVVAVLTRLARWPVGVATAIAVESAVLTNFFWHQCWTWRDRTDRGRRWTRFVRFHAANGMTSLVGNTVVTMFLTSFGRLDPIISNIVAVTGLGVLNYFAADRWVFARRAGIVVVIVAAGASRATAAELSPAAIAAWNKYVAQTEAALTGHEQDAPLPEPVGKVVDIDGAAIHEWRGSVRIHGTTVDQVVDALLSSEVRQEDVAESRVLERHGDSLRIYLKLVRRVIVSVTYDSEHDVRYVRRSSSFATSRSISTRIIETSGADRGFLWRLNSYWRYRQVGNDVQVDVLSLSLSRDIPWMVRPIAQPIITHVGRESMSRTLGTVQMKVAASSAGATLATHQPPAQ